MELICFRCNNYIADENAEHKNGHCIGICSITKNIGEFNNAIYYGAKFIPCNGNSFDLKKDN